jgi:type IV secretory pathway TraG/TraD family ATPase VirD4
MNYLDQIRQHRATSPAEPLRGAIPVLDEPTELKDDFWEQVAKAVACGLLFSFLGWLSGYGLHYFFYWKNDGAGLGFSIGLMVYFMWPVVAWLFFLCRHQKIPDPYFFGSYKPLHKFACFLVSAFLIYLVVDYLYPYIHAFSLRHHWSELSVYLSNKYPWPPLSKIIPTGKNDALPIHPFFVWLIIFISIIIVGVAFQAYRHRKQFRHVAKVDPGFKLWLGFSSGKLSSLAHGAGLASSQKISLSVEDAAQNILVLGGIGSGKTTRAIHPLLIQLLDQDCGGLIFDIKGDFQKAVIAFAADTQRPITPLGPGFESMNLLQGLTPEVAASFLKSAFLMSGKANMDAFWVETATELCRNSLGMLQFMPDKYSLYGLYRYLFYADEREQCDIALSDIAPTLSPKQAKQLEHYQQYYLHVFSKFDEKVKSGVFATLAQVLSPFHHPELIESFCTTSCKNFLMESVLEGNIYLVNLPLSVWGVGAKVVYSLIKLRFYNVMQQRTSREDWNQERSVFFMCDEFQEIVSANRDGLSDLNFWDKSRSSKTIGVISAQAVSSFYAAIGDHDVAHALLQNFRQKICFKTEDTATLNYFSHLVDKVDVIRSGFSKTKGTQKNSGDVFTSSRTESTTENYTFVEKSVLSPQLFRQLTPNQSVALLSIKGRSMDDIIEMMPIYVS